MSSVLRWIGFAAAKWALCIVEIGVWLLMLWQVAVVGLVAGPGDLVVVAAAGVAAGIALVIAHELGHALAGWGVGLPPMSLTLVFVRVDWQGGRPVLRPNMRLLHLAGVSYHAVAGAERWRVAAIFAAGPVVNLAIAGVCLALAAVLNPGPPAGRGPAAHNALRDVALVWPGSSAVAGLNVAGLASLLLGAFNLVPGRSAGFRTDGGQLLDLARGRDSLLVLQAHRGQPAAELGRSAAEQQKTR